MGLFDSIVNLLDDRSDNSLEKKLNNTLDKIEHTVGAAVDKAETGAKAVENAAKKADNIGKAVESVANKLPDSQKQEQAR